MTFRDLSPDDQAPLSDAIGSIRALAALPKAVMADLAQRSRLVSFAAGERLLTQGESSNFALLLTAGEVAIIDEGPHGEAQVGRIAAPALIGEIGALAQLPRTAGIRARSEVRALRLE